ncbi:MAG: YcxB family protein [Schleiferiaceae bacterium]|nr:YcxB family protein [Schleiferiaceae bacterium]
MCAGDVGILFRKRGDVLLLRGCFSGGTLWVWKVFSWRFRKHYRAHIKEYYSGRFGLEETLVLEDEVVISTNKLGESKLNISELEKISETRSHLFLHMSTGNTLIIPALADGVEAFKQTLVDKGVRVEIYFDWRF